MIVTFCGHSDFSEKPGDKSTVLDFLEKHVGESPCEFYLGGYGQFDSFAKKLLLRFSPYSSERKTDSDHGIPGSYPQCGRI